MVEVCTPLEEVDIDEVKACLDRGEQPLSCELFLIAHLLYGAQMQLKALTIRLPDWDSLPSLDPALLSDLLAKLTYYLFSGAATESLLTELNANTLGSSSRVARGTFDLGGLSWLLMRIPRGQLPSPAESPTSTLSLAT